MADHKYESFVNTDDYPRWTESFSEEERGEMMDDDMYVGRTVPLLLTALVIIGLSLATIALLVTA